MKIREKKMIPYSFQSISRKDIQSVVKVLKSLWITQGPQVAKFESMLTKVCGAKYAVAVSSGTAGLHLACKALGVSYGDEVITSPNSFVATSNSVLYCEGKPIFVDIEEENLNIDSTLIKEKVTPKTCGIIPIHFAGHPCQMNDIFKIARKNGLFVLEDACHALGARYQVGSKWYTVGSCSHSDAAVFSFHPVKSITTGEGGAVLTNRKDIYKKLLSLRAHGIVKNKKQFKNRNLARSKSKSSPWYYEMQDLGFNYRITDIQCALGTSQLQRVLSFVRRRREIVKMYVQAFKNLPGIILPREQVWAKSAHHLFVLRLKLEFLKADRAEIFDAFKKEGLGVQVHYIPIHLQPFYQKLGYQVGDFPVSEKYYQQAISLPLFPSMTNRDIAQIIRVVQQVVNCYLL